MEQLLKPKKEADKFNYLLQRHPLDHVLKSPQIYNVVICYMFREIEILNDTMKQILNLLNAAFGPVENEEPENFFTAFQDSEAGAPILPETENLETGKNSDGVVE